MGDIYLIKDLSRVSGFSIYTLKYYLKLGLINGSGRFPETNFRYFDNATLEALRKIHELRKEKKSLQEIRGILDQGGQR